MFRQLKPILDPERGHMPCLTVSLEFPNAQYYSTLNKVMVLSDKGNVKYATD